MMFSLDKLDISVAYNSKEIPPYTNFDDLISFLHHKMKPYNDAIEDVKNGVEFALANEPYRNGFIAFAGYEERLIGTLVMLQTGMSGFIPGNILLFVAVDPTLRGKGIGKILIEEAKKRCQGPIKLHVETENPARRLYERMGFTSKYVEMRLDQ